MTGYDEYSLHMPSGRQMYLRVPTPLTVADRDWLHNLVDLILVKAQPGTTETTGTVYEEMAI